MTNAPASTRMRGHRLIVMLAALASVAPATARGEGAVVGKAGEALSVSTARIAAAWTAETSTTWAQVSVAGASGGFVWIVPVRPGARIDLGSDAWLDALDAATSPVVLPPSAAVASDACDAGGSPERVPAGTSPRSTRPSRAAVFVDETSLDAFVDGAGYASSASLATKLAPLFAVGGAVFAGVYDTAVLPTRTLRVVEPLGPDGAPVLRFALAAGRGAGEETQVTAFVIAAAGAQAGSSPLALDAATLLWEGDGASTYLPAREALVEEWQGTRWLTESASPGLLFDGAPIAAEPVTSLPSVLGQYFALASTYGDVSEDPAACFAAASATQSLSAPYAAVCPPGALAIAPGPNACMPPGAPADDAAAPIDPLLCGGAADDAALALASLAPAGIWVTRIDGIVTAASAADVALSTAVTSPSGPVVTASVYATSCASPVAPPVSPPTALPSSPAPAPSSGGSGSDATDAAPVGEGCGAGLAEACNSSDSSGDEGDDSCDSSSDPKSDDDSSSGGCGSSDSSSSNSDCAAAGQSVGGARRRRVGRSPVSRVLLLLVAVAAIARRQRRVGRFRQA